MRLTWEEVEDRHQHLLKTFVVRAGREAYKSRSLPDEVTAQRRRCAKIAVKRKLTLSELATCYPAKYLNRIRVLWALSES
jgi:hypothetical protein